MKNPVVVGILGLIIGLVVGFFGANTLNRSNIAPQPSGANTGPTLPGTQLPAGGPQQPGGGMMPDVAEAIEKAKNEPDNIEAQTKVGDMYSRIQRFDKAAEFYERAANIKPEDFDVVIRAAGNFFEARQFENAAKYYEKALQIKPGDIDARTDLGATYLERQSPDIDRGIQEFQKSLEIDPKHEPTLFNLAVAYNKKGDKESFQSTLARLEAVNPASRYVTRLRQVSQQQN